MIRLRSCAAAGSSAAGVWRQVKGLRRGLRCGRTDFDVLQMDATRVQSVTQRIQMFVKQAICHLRLRLDPQCQSIVAQPQMQPYFPEFRRVEL